MFKIASFDHLYELLNPYKPNRTLRSLSKIIVRIRHSVKNSAAFSIWYSLLMKIRYSILVETFKKTLKTYFFEKCYLQT